MPSDYENGAKKTIDISIKAEKMTADVLKSALQEFMSGKAEKKGRMTYKQLQATQRIVLIKFIQYFVNLFKARRDLRDTLLLFLYFVSLLHGKALFH